MLLPSLLLGAGAVVHSFRGFGPCAELASRRDAPAATVLDRPSVRLPIDASRQFLGVELRLNGKGPFLLHIDTYATHGACLDELVVRRPGADPRRVRSIGE